MSTHSTTALAQSLSVVDSDSWPLRHSFIGFELVAHRGVLLP
jgi:hypothetical protein